MKKLVVLSLVACIFATVIPVGAATEIVGTLVILPKAPNSMLVATKNLVDDAVAGTLKTNTTSAPTDYVVVCNRRFDWYNLVYSTSTSMLDGKLNPNAPFDKELGQVLCLLIDAKTVGDNLSLDMGTVNSVSLSDGESKSLWDGIALKDWIYNPLTIGIRSDGSVINGGPATQKCQRLLLVVEMKLFNGGGTQAGLDSVRGYIDYYVSTVGDFVMQYTIQFGDAKAFASASIKGLNVTVPRLAITRQGIYVSNGETNRSYRVYGRTSVASGAWVSQGVVSYTNMAPIATGSGMKFFRAVVQ